MRLGIAARSLAIALVPITAGTPARSAGHGPLRSDDVLVTKVYEPTAGSGVMAFYAQVTGITSRQRGRTYFILYGGRGQVLPAAGERCRIAYRNGELLDWVDSKGSPLRRNIAERFACGDGRDWPKGTQPRP